ncbi:hypothetical protein DCCM_2327 [Desulfocucumis palustris]|uniref:Uncharacterized protein n=1 Tax=Desulfocucumis palustris TaxID=1898651 RepID=A0A2L2XAM1_9FIRM|nr:hypothetical protein DCCM_2327 [Desulfocucumis palustris]
MHIPLPSFLNRYPHGISRLFADFGADVLAQTDDVTDRTVWVLHAHIDDAPVIRLTIKGGANPDSAFSELRFHVIWEGDVRTINVGDFLNECVIFVNFIVHKSSSDIVFFAVCGVDLCCAASANVIPTY